MEKMTKKERGIYLFKKYGYLIVFGVCALVLIIALIASNGTKGKGNVVNNVDGKPVNASKLTFGLPLLNAEIIKGYSNTKLQYNETLKQYEAHLATDFSCEDGSNVLSVANGTVEEVGNNYLRGNYVVINHGNNLKSVYGSLGDNVSVKVGQNVSKGDVIGTAGKTAHSELSAGTHLHFEMLDNDKKIDPSGYLMLENK